MIRGIHYFSTELKIDVMPRGCFNHLLVWDVAKVVDYERIIRLLATSGICMLLTTIILLRFGLGLFTYALHVKVKRLLAFGLC